MTTSRETAVRTRHRDGILVVSLDGPDRRNALGVQTRHDLTDAVEDANADPAVRAVVLTGAGGHFCAGGDLSARFEPGRLNRERMHGANDAIRAIVRSAKPVVAAVDGVAYGVGVSLAVACDLVVASESARFCTPFTGVGLTGDGGLHHLLPRRVGLARARRLILTGEVLDVATAVGWGLVDSVAAGDESALDVALHTGEQLARRAPLAVAATKQLLARADTSLDEMLDAELAAQVRLMESADFAEGRDAFFAKRPPVFTGR